MKYLKVTLKVIQQLNLDMLRNNLKGMVNQMLQKSTKKFYMLKKRTIFIQRSIYIFNKRNIFDSTNYLYIQRNNYLDSTNYLHIQQNDYFDLTN